MKALQLATLTALTLALAVIAWELTMTVTMFGGWLPLIIITIAPVLGYGLGRSAQ